MIFTKSSLQIVQIVEPDKEIAAFNTVTFLKNGAIVAGNRKVFFWISPLPADIKNVVPLDEGKFTKTVTFWADSIKDVVRAIPRDTQYKGLLEHADISLHNNGNYYATINNGMSTHKIELRQSSEHLGGWKEVFKRFTNTMIEYGDLERDNSIFYTTMNRKRLIQMLSVLEKVIAYNGNYSPVHLYFSAENAILIRCKNELNDQRVCIISTTQDYDDYPLNEHEKGLLYE